MPMYDFYCSSCSCEFEDMVGPDEACPPCPNCGSEDTERLLSAANLKHGAKPFKVGPVRPMPPKPLRGGGPCGAEAVAAAVCSQKPLVSMIQAVFLRKKGPGRVLSILLRSYHAAWLL